MILISHRGNISGRIPERENTEEYILEALSLGYNVEIDLWRKNGEWWLGHDNPQFKTNGQFLNKEGLWIHCKDIESLSILAGFQDDFLNFFYHTDEDVVLTSWKFLWTYPGNILYKNSICVLPEMGYVGNLKNCYGICSDCIENYKQYD